MDRFLTASQIAEILQISKAKVYLLIQNGKIPYVRLDRNVRVRESELMKWLEKQTVKSEI